MAIGFLQLDPNYLGDLKHPNNPNKLWHDEPDNTFLPFQFDPAKLKLTIPTRWVDGPTDTASADFRVHPKYNNDTTDNQEKISLVLHFTDFLPHRGTVTPSTWTKNRGANIGAVSTQRSLEILEAMALPLQDIGQQTVKSMYFTERKRLLGWTEDKKNLALSNEEIADRAEYKKWRTRRDNRVPVAVSRSTEYAKRTTVLGKRLSEMPHPPRPLLLHLVTPSPFGCVLQKLELEIIALDSVTGMTQSANAKVTFVAFNSDVFKDGYNGLIQAGTVNLGELDAEGKERVSLENWNIQLSTGGNAIQTVEPKEELVKRRFDLRKNKGATSKQITSNRLGTS